MGSVTRNNIKLHKLAKQIDTNTEIVDRLNKQIAAANKRIEESDDEIADLNKASILFSKTKLCLIYQNFI